MEDLDISVTDYSWMENRNGLRDIRKVVISYTNTVVLLSGIGKSGKLLRGGIGVTVKDMDLIATEWLKCRKIAKALGSR